MATPYEPGPRLRYERSHGSNGQISRGIQALAKGRAPSYMARRAATKEAGPVGPGQPACPSSVGRATVQSMRKLAFAGLLAGLVAGCPGSDDADDETGMTMPTTMPTTSVEDDTGTNETEALECPFDAPMDTTDGASDPLMQTWGAPCSTDADCVALIGEGAECMDMAVIYELPGGFCSKPCSLPDTSTTFVNDDPACDPNGGVTCVGQRPLFEYCALPCTDDAQCNRDGYYCRTMPAISNPGDPTFCLMPDCCEGSC